MAFDQGAPQFGLADCKIQTWASAGTYSGSITDVMSVQMVGVTMQQVSAQLTGDDRITATASRAIGGQVQMRFGGINLDSLAIMLGLSIGTISSVEQILIGGGDRMPYFGIIGKALAEESLGDFWVYCPKAKLMGDFQIAMLEYGAFAIPEVTVQLVDDTSYGIINLITHPTEVAITVMPPANIAVNS
jgi:hypothetical protein